MGASLAMLLLATVWRVEPPVTGQDASPTEIPVPAEPSPAVTELRAASLSGSGIDREAFREALRLRVPGVPLRDHGPTPPEEPYVHVGVWPGERGSFELSVIVSDGRAYDRVVAVRGDDAAREVATHVANLLVAIAEGRIEADREDVPMPEPEPVEEVVQPVEQEPSGPVPPQATPGPPKARMQVGLNLSGVAVLGLGPPADLDRFSGAGGSLGVRLRFRNGVLLGFAGSS